MNKLYNDDCLNVLNILEDSSIDIIFTSPPYNLGKCGYKTPSKYDTYKYNKYHHKCDINDNWTEWLTKIILLGIKKSKYFFLNVQSLSSNKVDIINLMYNLKNYYCDTIIWNKDNGIPHGFNERVMTATFEYIHIFSLTPTKQVGTKKWKGTVKNVANVKGNKQNKDYKIHRAIWPKEICEWVITNFTNENDTVADIFMGLGNCGIVSKKLNRNFIGVELDEKYFTIAKERIGNE